MAKINKRILNYVNVIVEYKELMYRLVQEEGKVHGDIDRQLKISKERDKV